ncbi:pyridoxal 5'-phosphate synthase glutaminase subunit PdxT [Anaerosporobacter faecicola]|uniref:pyridoxal 5'-phosphate synthase glutaminase subunit PdxT n=1 Tax=Anaerosporobacter faecicola TaxID=2718714 RepID=UPI001438E31D|nr:pyridoxal 5'-phosphate synthase glutaminase subunit PdxT [Anaerosporobacter faecicola]
MRIGVVAVQGAFLEHEIALGRLGVHCIELRQKKDVLQSYDAIILPGGESTVQGKLLKELDMFEIIQSQINDGMPVLGTCAGMILLAEHISNDSREYFKTLPVTVRRNAYGRQLGSFHIKHTFASFGEIPMTFIRAPYIESADPNVQILAKVDEKIVAVQYLNQIALSFHPELDNDTSVYERFIKQITKSQSLQLK